MGEDIDNKKCRLQIYIIHSVKGGSGKTAYSIFKALSLAKTVGTKRGKAQTLYMDADFKGTALKAVIYGMDQASYKVINNHPLETFEGKVRGEYNMENGSALCFKGEYKETSLNHYLLGDVTRLSSFLVKGGVYGQKLISDKSVPNYDYELEGLVDFIFSSSKAEDKIEFKYENDENEFPMLGLGQFSRKMEELLEEIWSYGAMDDEEKGTYRYLVIDMPPAEDEYSRTLLKLLRRMKQKHEGEIALYYYAITTNDRGHLHAEFEEFAAVALAKKKRDLNYDKYIMVFNQLQQGEFQTDDIEYQKKELRQQLGESGISEKSKFYYCVNQYQKQYYTFCRRTDVPAFTYEEGNEEELYE